VCGPIGRRGEERLVVLELLALELTQLRIAPRFLTVLGKLSALEGVVRAVTDRGRALLADDLAAAVHVSGVAAREHRRAGELRLRELVVEQHAFVAEAVAGKDARPEEPPLVAAEKHVRAFDRALDRGGRAVRVVGADRERERRDQTAEAALRGVGLVEVERVRVLHRLRPAPNVVRADGLLQLSAAERDADPAVDIRRVERDVGCHMRCPSAALCFADAADGAARRR